MFLALAVGAASALPIALPSNCTIGTNVYYISLALGSDSNTQTQAKSTATPWAHAPAMHSFTGSYTHTAGDCFLFRGGETWNVGTTDYLVISNGGTSLGQDYYGASLSWYSGLLWSRYIFDMQSDQPNLDSNGAAHMVEFASSNWVMFDSVEVINGKCTTTGGHAGGGIAVYYFGPSPSTTSMDGISVTGSYFHQFTSPTGGCGSGTTADGNGIGVWIYELVNNSGGCDGSFDHNVVNGSDGSGVKGYDTIVYDPAPCVAISSNVVHDVCSGFGGNFSVANDNTIFNFGAAISQFDCSTQGIHEHAIRSNVDLSASGNVIHDTAGEALMFNPQSPLGVNLDDTLTGWQYCWSGGSGGQLCTPGGTGTVTAGPSQTINNTTPSLDGDAMQIGFTGTAFTDVLFWYQAGAHNSTTYLTSDFDFYVSSFSNVQALEYDIFQYIHSSLDDYIYGTQFVIGGSFQLWNGIASTWNSTAVPASSISAGAWNHVHLDVHRVPGDTSCSGRPCMHYDRVVIDGIPYALNTTYPDAILPGTYSDQTGLNFQVDTNSSGGAVVESLDEVNFYGGTSQIGPGGTSTLAGSLISDNVLYHNVSTAIQTGDNNVNTTGAAWIVGNTVDGDSGGTTNGTFRALFNLGSLTFANNHFIYPATDNLGGVCLNKSPFSTSGCSGATVTTLTYAGPTSQTCTANSCYETMAQANLAGYTSTQTWAYSPTLTTSPTVGIGVNESALGITTDTQYGVTGNAPSPARTAQTLPSSGAWSAGAYYRLPAAKALDFGPPIDGTGINCGLTTPTVAASTLYPLKAWVVPSPTNGHFYSTTTSGTTGSGAQPTFNTGSGSTTTWGGAIFTERGTTNFNQCPDDVSLYVYGSGQFDGVTFDYNWTSLENSNGGCTASAGYTYTALDAQINAILSDSNFPATAKVGIIVSGISAGSGPNTHTPCYVFSSTYAAAVGSTTMPVGFCGASSGQGASYPGSGVHAVSATGSGVFTDGLDTTGYPWTPSVPYSTAWQNMWDNLIAHINASSYASRIVYSRIGIMQGGEVFPHCISLWKTYFSQSTAQIKTTITNYALQVYSHEAASGASFPLMAGADGTCVDAVSSCIIGYGWANIEAGGTVSDFLSGGFGSQGATESDIAAYNTYGYANGGTASTSGTYCAGNFCYLFHNYSAQPVHELQTLAASCPQGLNQCGAGTQQSQTGTLVNILPFWTFIDATDGEIYDQDWLLAWDPNYSGNGTYGSSYQTAITNFRASSVGPPPSPSVGGIFGASSVTGKGIVK